MKNIREIGRNILMVGGLLTAGISEIDGLAASFADKEQQAFMANRAGLQEKYGVIMTCVQGSQPFAGGCIDEVPGVSKSEESRILSSYNEELTEKDSVVPPEVDARRRQGRDIAGLFGGLAMAGLAGRMKRKKE